MATRTYDGNITRLPKWAQHHIDLLERDVEHWKKKATAGPDDSDTFILNFTEDDTPLGSSPRISFHLPDGAINVHIVDGYLRVAAEQGGNLHVLPSAANSVNVVVGEG